MKNVTLRFIKPGDFPPACLLLGAPSKRLKVKLVRGRPEAGGELPGFWDDSVAVLDEEHCHIGENC